MHGRIPVFAAAFASLGLGTVACGGVLRAVGAGDLVPMDSAKAVAIAEKNVCGRAMPADDRTCVVVGYAREDGHPVVTLDRNPPAGNDRVSVTLKNGGDAIEVAPVPRTGHFSLILEHSSQGWRASCETGCRWREVTLDCAGCEVLLTSVGIGPANDPAQDLGTFAFTLADSSSGWSAKAVRGSHWLTLGFGCPQAVCRTRIDEAGVSGS